MQFSTIFAAAALVASAAATNGTVSVYTAWVTTYEAVTTSECPPGSTYVESSVTKTATIPITVTEGCGCTKTYPVVYTSTPAAVIVPTTASVAPVYTNGTVATTAVASKSVAAVGTTSAKASTTATPSTITASGADKLALSGVSLAGLMAFAAYLL